MHFRPLSHQNIIFILKPFRYKLLPVSIDTLLPTEPKSTREEEIQGHVMDIDVVMEEISCTFSCPTYLYQLRSQGLAHCATSQDVGVLRYSSLHLLRPSHSSQPFVEGIMVVPGRVARYPDRHSAHWQLRRMKWEEQRRSGQLLGAREWRGEVETLGWRIAVERWSSLLLPAGNSYWLAWPDGAILETCRTKYNTINCGALT